MHNHPLLAALGALLVLAVAYDGARTTLSASASGPLTRRLSASAWQLLLAIHHRYPNHALLGRAGSGITLLLILTWVGLAWAGWALIFCGAADAVLNSNSFLAASVAERIYYAGFTVTTLGVGDFIAHGTLWQILSTIAAGNGLLLFTMSITYAIPIMSAATEKRQLALAINTLGESPAAIYRQTVGDGDFDALRAQLEQVEMAIAGAGQKHLAYPILHYFHSADTMTSLPLALVRLDQTLSLIAGAVQDLPQATRARIEITQHTIASFLATLESAFIRPSAEPPTIPSLDAFEDLPFFDAEPQAMRAKLAVQDRQPLLHAYVRDDGWRWQAVWDAGQASGTVTDGRSALR